MESINLLGAVRILGEKATGAVEDSTERRAREVAWRRRRRRRRRRGRREGWWWRRWEGSPPSLDASTAILSSSSYPARSPLPNLTPCGSTLSLTEAALSREIESLWLLTSATTALQPSQRRLPLRQVYKSVHSKCSEQILEATVGKNALLAVIPDPVTCFSTARYSQKQVFRVHSDSNLVVVDWITSGRHESGEQWEFDLYMSTNHIYLEADQPLFLDSVLLDQNSCISIAKRMQEYQVMAMIILLGPKLKDLRCQLQEEVKQMMSVHFRAPNAVRTHNVKSESPQRPTRAPMIASSSPFGPQGLGMVVRIVAVNTESVYKFLRHHLAALDAFIGASPYSQSGR